MDFTIANGLSMQGGDDIGDIQDNIDLINATAVFKAGTQTITGDKTFNGDVIINNTNTTIQTSGTNTNTGSTITEVATTAFKVQSVAGTDKLNIAPTVTTNTNATITEVATTEFKVQSVAGTDKLNISPTTTTLTNPTTNILDGTGQGLQLTSALVELNATVANTLNLKVDSINKLSATNVLTTNTNTTITDVATTRNFQVVAGTTIASITSGGLGVSSANISLTKNLSTDSAGIVTIRNGALNSGSPHVLVEKYTSGILFGSNTRYRNGAISASSISGGVETEVYIAGFSTTALDLTVPTITNVATTSFKVQSVAGTDKLTITPTLTTIGANPITLSALGALNATASTFINFSSTTSSAYTATTSLALTGGTSAQLTATTTNSISSSGAVSDAIQIDASSASGGIKMRINAVEKIFINNGVTEITNTSVDIVGNCYAPSYSIGTHASSVPLCNYSFNGFKLMGTVQTTNITMTPDNGAWNGSFTIDRFRSALPFVPYAYELSIDNGTAIVGTATSCSITVTLLNGSSVQFATGTETGVALNTAFQEYRNGTFSSVTKQVAGTQILLRFQYTANGTVTTNLKGLSCKVWGYQS